MKMRHRRSSWAGIFGIIHSILIDVKGLEKLTQLTYLDLDGNRALTKAQIAELQKALPKCKILSNPTK
jgi:hypothetical protein